ncbi:phosphoadenylyl-sulfate reductase [Croceicoccus naphthovorans]|uniref:Adenosine 5'-phosphosulfate reductase n=2 Tax=Croceicoccus naphthovorans TaxID=1348774 RepID=A0A0G3XJT8_9SPHN|nr:phosphoadenylyl-sulfate reductase [Croceicoccus naphthovorans]AKM11825.1 phosphoadenosine phosphosulfate reductase [Croceicoccus naphthovorans]
MEAVRRLDRIDTGVRFTADDAAALNARYAGASAEDILRAVLIDGVAGRIALVSSFGAESSVLLHLASKVAKDAPVLFLETGKHFPETLEYRDLLAERFGLTGLINLTPDADALAAKDESGLRWSYDPDGCCEIRKVIPLAKALTGYDASITGRKAFQSATRAELPVFEIDTSDSAGRLKVNPLIGWSRDDLIAYMDEHELPRHPLVAKGYPSIGCMPCTSTVAEGEDPRSGRWRGWDKTECGIHQVPGLTKDGDLPPDFDPVF